MSGSGLYYLMHKDDTVTTMEIDEVTGNITKISPTANRELLPPGGNLSQNDLKKWWERRAVPRQQGIIEKILKEQNICTTQAFLAKNLGLSLTDHYWIKPLDSALRWEQVNLFENDFSDDIGELQFRQDDELSDRIHLTGITTFYPSASTQGELQKKWVIQDGKRCLIKGNYGPSCQQSVNEIIASTLHEKQGKMPFTKYRLCDIRVDYGQTLGCFCEDFASAEIEFISAYDVSCSEKKDNAVSEYEHFIAVCVRHGLEEKEVRTFLEYQILTDFVLTNTDRHLNNFGILRDTSTLQFKGMAPIFDSGNSMFWNSPTLPLTDPLLDIPVSSFRKKETDLLRYVQNCFVVDIEKLPDEQEIRALLRKGNIPQSQIDGIVKGYLRKIELFHELQQGQKIWSYKYRHFGEY